MVRYQSSPPVRYVAGRNVKLIKTVANVHLKHNGKHALIPQPSNDPNDPLNWSRTWKWLAMSSMALSTFNYAFSPLSLSPQVPYYMESFDSTLPEVINFIGVSVLVLGFTNFIWIPLSRGFGRRPSYYTHHYGFVHLACQSDDVQFFPWFGRSLRNWFVAGRDTGSCNYCGHCIPP
jgi:hypothetical protein